MLGTRNAAALIIVLIGSASSLAQPRTLSFDERVAAQKAIEQVYWNHRIWPTENPGPKPPLAAVMPDAAIRAKVIDYLKKTNALETRWQRPIDAEQLQAELDRMAIGTKDARMLRELYRALGNDPLVIAETLARQSLVDRLIRAWYSSDTRIHGELKAKAEAVLAVCTDVDCIRKTDAEYFETTWKQADDSAEEWTTRLDRLGAVFGLPSASLPSGRLSPLEEAADAFVVTVVLAQRDDELKTASVAWPKRPFDAWWSEERVRTSANTMAPAGEYTLATPTGGPCVNDTWQGRFYAPSWRHLHTAVWTGTEMIVWGGYDFSTSLNTGGRYNPSTDSWTATSTGANVPSKTRAHTAVWTGTEMIVWGGYDGAVALNTGGRYSPTTDSWLATSTGANVPPERSNHTAVWTGTQMIVWGGTGSTYLNTGGRYNPTTDSWLATSTGTNVPAVRHQHAAVWTGTQMIVWGGYSYDGTDHFLNTGGRYDPATNLWLTTATSANAIARHSHAAVWTGTHMVVWGGYVPGSTTNTGGRYNPVTNAWLAVSTGANVPAARFHHAAVWTGTYMVVWGGSGPGYLNTGGRYNPATNAWLATSVGANVPEARQYPTAVWTGTEMIVWAGTSNALMNTGGRYNPSTDSWLATPTGANVPLARSDHTAVWTGTEMIAWGGASTSYQNTGGRYLPATDTWTATSTGANVPAGRSLHTAVWTGTEMMVWGGSSVIPLNTGGRYNPSTDSWLATSTGANVPGARRYHSAVWTGTRMIVWGGYDGSVFLNAGGGYAPSTDTWLATSTGPNVPSSRSFHSAVWTGEDMVVWGGDSPGGLLNTGGRYSPSTDSWTETSTSANVPAVRGFHSAAWTGSEMIVWGGISGLSSYLNTGGRYNPSTDNWMATSTGANVPGARRYHSTIWTGVEMIVWGGQESASTPNSNTGGRYDPSTDSWTATSTGANVPSAGRSHSAVWTGAEMIVWAGVPINNNLGLYCGCTQATYYRDVDGDSYGNATVSISACEGSSPTGYVADDTDCNDASASIHPGVAESCNGLDDDCDFAIDNGGAALCSDGNSCTDDACEGIAGCGHASNASPCDDGNACTTGDACSGGSCAGTPGSAPSQVSSLSASKTGATATFDWSAIVGAINYDVLRGRVRDWPVGSNPSTETCFDDVFVTTAQDATVPAIGDGYWYLIRAENACGSGGYGSQATHGAPTVPRMSGTCP